MVLLRVLELRASHAARRLVSPRIRCSQLYTAVVYYSRLCHVPAQQPLGRDDRHTRIVRPQLARGCGPLISCSWQPTLP